MSKGKALGLTIVFGSLALTFLFVHWLICMVSFLIVAAGCGALWFSKYQRDRKFAVEHQLVQAQTISNMNT